MAIISGRRRRTLICAVSSVILWILLVLYPSYSTRRPIATTTTTLLQQPPRDAAGSASLQQRASNGHPSALQKINAALAARENCSTSIQINNMDYSEGGGGAATDANTSSAFCNCETALISTTRIINLIKDPCCRRTFVSVHKMGHLLLNRFRQREFPTTASSIFLKSHSSRTTELIMAQQQHPSRDYREVVIGRDWYDALISGYLYHKSGKECDSDWNGNAASNLNAGASLVSYDWEAELRAPISMPAVNNRTLCEYLAQENEATGMSAYVSFALSRWLLPLLEFHEQRERDATVSSCGSKTIYLCIHDLETANAEHYVALTKGLRQWLVPGLVRWKSAVSRPPVSSAGGHATDTDTRYRLRLKRLVESVDVNHWNGLISKSSPLFGCPSDLE